MRSEMLPDGFRPCVAAVILDADSRVLLGARIDRPEVWQVPQGGIDPGEDPQEALLRELAEEIGTAEVDILGQASGWLAYIFPPELAHTRLAKRFKGQAQRWFLVRLRPGAAIRLDAHDPPEFSTIQWVAYDAVMDWCEGFKAEVYRAALADLRPLALTGQAPHATTAETTP